MLERWLDELDERNTDNVSRTESYLALYQALRADGVELPWILMAHLVSRNAGYLMSDEFYATLQHLNIGSYAMLEPAAASSDR